MSIEEKLTTIAENEQKVYDAGAQREYDRFWDIVQQSGNRTGYRHTFENADFTHIDPKHPIRAASAEGIMQMARKLVSVNWDKFDLSGATSLYCAFAFCTSLKKIDTELGLNNGTATLMNSLCRHCYELVSVKKVIASPVYVWKDSFEQCAALEEIRFDGEIGAGGFNMQWSTKLSKASFESVIGHLSVTTSGLSVTFSKIAIDNAFETSTGSADGSTSSEWTALANTRSNWTINLV